MLKKKNVSLQKVVEKTKGKNLVVIIKTFLNFYYRTDTSKQAVNTHLVASAIDFSKCLWISRHPICRSLILVTYCSKDALQYYTIIVFIAGVIKTALPKMDRENREQYQVVIQAKDMGGQMGGLSGTTTVNITLLDVNDNPPRYPQSKINLLFIFL